MGKLRLSGMLSEYRERHVFGLAVTEGCASAGKRSGTEYRCEGALISWVPFEYSSPCGWLRSFGGYLSISPWLRLVVVKDNAFFSLSRGWFLSNSINELDLIVCWTSKENS